MHGDGVNYLHDLRKALLELPATGCSGFEGLIAVALTAVTGVPFRLAAGGSQFGVDGKSAYDFDGVCFEGKRYDGKVPKNEVLTKVSELAISDDGEADLWVLGSTAPIASQLADSVRKLGHELGLGTLLLDWADDGIPSLAVALAMSNTAVGSFLDQHLSDRSLSRNANAALAEIRSAPGFDEQADRLHVLLTEPTLGFGIGKSANLEWLTNVLSDPKEAKLRLGQPLSPLDPSRGDPLPREYLVRRVANLSTGQPDDRVIVVLGDEGVGKSWLVAQSWLSLQAKPVMLILTPHDFMNAGEDYSPRLKLVRKLVEQTGSLPATYVEKRWHRRWARWRRQPPPPQPRLVVYIDGLNQRPRLDWARILGLIASELAEIGGRLVVTTRTEYYRGSIQARLAVPADDVLVPEWTAEERDSLLSSRGIRGENLPDAVAKSLNNPRLLGIALRLLDDAQLKSLQDLSVSRLLFEHMRANEREAPVPLPARKFARKLEDHAREVLSRLASQQLDDLSVFEEAEAAAVADGRFFVPVEGDPTRYSIEEHGLSLALGFAVLSDLRSARRNHHDLDAAVAEIVDPIDALDRTADVMLAALTVACLDEQCSVEIGSALVAAFAQLQNPDPAAFDSFAALARARPEAFTEAAFRLSLAGGSQPNLDWVEAALHEARAGEEAWLAISGQIRKWLSCYSLTADEKLLKPGMESAEKVRELEKKQSEIASRLDALTANERAVLDGLSRCDGGEVNRVARLAFRLLLDKPLASFAKSFVQWSFANAINPGRWAPDRELDSLLSLNPVDWKETREALSAEWSPLSTPEASTTGRWTLVRLLQATGHSEDGARATSLVDELTAGQPRFPSWRLVEDYCESDPCDPDSQKPANVKDTAARYAALDVSKLNKGVGPTANDHFFSMARPGVARFEPKVAVQKHKELILDLINRRGLNLRQGLFAAMPHNALADRKTAERVLEHCLSDAAESSDEVDPARQRWIVSQYGQLFAFPLLEGTEQIDTMLADDSGEDFLLRLVEVLKPVDGKAFETHFLRASREDDRHALYRLLALARTTSTTVPRTSWGGLESITTAEASAVRAQAFGLIAGASEPDLLAAVARSGWSAAVAEEDNDMEAWHGSIAVLEAANHGIISDEEAVDRITPRAYGRAAGWLSERGVREIAIRVDAAIRRVVDLGPDLGAPGFALGLVPGDDLEPVRYSRYEAEPASTDVRQFLEQASEDDRALEARQRHEREAFARFRQKLTSEQAHIILDDIRIAEFDRIADADRGLAESWLQLFMSLPEPALAPVHNVGVLLAHSLAAWKPDDAADLFKVLSNTRPLLSVSVGYAQVPLEVFAVWSAAGDAALDEMCLTRLDDAGNNHQIALEVVAAMSNGQEKLIERYLETRLDSGEPAKVARALTVAGFSDASGSMEDLLASWRDSSGLVGRAWRSAQYAYERNKWAVTWFRAMCAATDPDDFWRQSVLFAKIVDGRFGVWQATIPEREAPFQLFWPSVERKVGDRIAKWKQLRVKKLYGEDAPAQIFGSH